MFWGSWEDRDDMWAVQLTLWGCSDVALWSPFLFLQAWRLDARGQVSGRAGACWLWVARGLTDCPLSQAPRVCRAGADPGGPPPAVCAGLQPGSARVEAGLWAAGVVRQPRAEVCGSVWEWGLCSHHELCGQPGRASVMVSEPLYPNLKPLI